MKLSENKIEVQVSEGLTTSNFGISIEDAPHILIILRDKLYSNKIQAVVREYSTNAVDAHVESGKSDLPINITIPTRFSPLFKVRDFGTGLDEKSIRQVYTQYGKSTKRNSNEVIGQLGLGCKSGFAYNDSFTITSWINGVKSSYSAYIDPSQLGAITKLGEEPSDEPSGIEITIPVKITDLNTFLSECANVFKYFKVQPKFLDAPANFKVVSDRAGEFLVDSKKGWYIPETQDYYNTSSVAIMGNIGYPINLGSIPEKKQIHEFLLNCGVRIEFAIGDLSIAANREHLEYTPDTRANIIHRLNAILNEIKHDLEENIKKAPNIFAATQIYGDLYIDQNRHSNRYSNFLRTFMKNTAINWKGQPVSNILLTSGNVQKHNLTGYYISHDYGAKYSSTELKTRLRKRVDTLPVNTKLYLAFFEGDLKKHVARAKVKFEEILALVPKDKKNSTLLVLTGKRSDWDAFCAAHNLVAENWIELDKVAAPVVVSTGGGVRGPRRAKHMHLFFKFDPTVTNGHVKSNYWKMVEVDTSKGGIYVVIDHFYPVVGGRSRNPRDVINDIKKLTTLGIAIDSTNIIGVRKSEVPKVTAPNWIPYEKHVLEKIEAYMVTQKIDEIVTNHSEWMEHFNSTDVFAQEAIKELDKDSPVNKFLAHMQELKCDDTKYRSYEQILGIYNAFAGPQNNKNLKPKYCLKKEIKDLEGKYPLLVQLGFFRTRPTNNNAFYYMQQNKASRDAIFHYIKLVERT